MKMPQKISAAVITFNEEKNIGRCLASLQGVADEIIIVDSYSQDGTEHICREYGATFLQRPFEGYFQQKNYALSKTQHPYVLSLDADEVLSAPLRAAILREKSHFRYQAYQFNRLTNYCGQWIRHCGWYPDRKIRLWNRSLGQWGGGNPHERVILAPKTTLGHLHGDILHYSYYSVSDHIKQIQFFTDMSAREALQKGKTTHLAALLVKPVWKFFRDYVIRLGFLDGFYGLVICVNSAFAKWLKYLKIYERSRKA